MLCSGQKTGSEQGPFKMAMQKDFNWSDEWEPHQLRRKQILEKYGPQIKELYGPDIWTAVQVAPHNPFTRGQITSPHHNTSSPG